MKNLSKERIDLYHKSIQLVELLHFIIPEMENEKEQFIDPKHAEEIYELLFDVGGELGGQFNFFKDLPKKGPDGS